MQSQHHSQHHHHSTGGGGTSESSYLAAAASNPHSYHHHQQQHHDREHERDRDPRDERELELELERDRAGNNTTVGAYSTGAGVGAGRTGGGHYPLSASPSSGQPAVPKAPAKVSCLACRAAKRKCLTANELTICKRCADQGLECEYKKHRRGRRKKVVEDGANGAGTGSSNKATAAAASADKARSPRRSSPGSARSHSGSPSRSRSPPLRREAVIKEDRDHNRLRGRLDREHERREYALHHHHAHDDDPDALSGTSNELRAARHAIQFSHVVPIEGDSSPYLPRPGVPPDPTSGPSLAHLRTDCPDPVANGFLTEADAFELFEFYFHHLNMTVAILDPVLHTATYCREKSPLLYSAVLTVTAKIIRPKAYSSCLLIANKLVGQAVEFGLCSIEVVQAILVLTHWKKADDATSWRKTGYAIRMAQELRLNHRAPRPLPRNERQAREVLNRERTWLNLIVADYHLAMHHSLPRMINEDDTDDPTQWITEHPHLPCPGEGVIAPWITFSRMCRLFADMLASMNGSHSNLRSLHWLEMEWKRWRKHWLEKNGEYNFLPQHIATLKLCDKLFHFHITEYRLLFCARYRANGEQLDTSVPSELSYAFAACADVALSLLEVFQMEFVRNGFLPFCFNLTWVGVAITSVWLIKNIGAMDHTDRGRVIRTLTECSESTLDSSCSSDDMASYTHRLLKHLLGSLSSDYLLSATAPPAGLGPAPEAIDGPPAAPAGPPLPPTWSMPSAQQIIQEHLWHPSLFDAPQPNLQPGSAGPGPGVSPLPANAQGTIMPDGVPGQIPTDVLFPAADDDIWKLLFPL